MKIAFLFNLYVFENVVSDYTTVAVPTEHGHKLFSAPEPKDHTLSVVFHIFDFFSETAEWNSTNPREDAGGLSREYVLHIPSVS